MLKGTKPRLADDLLSWKWEPGTSNLFNFWNLVARICVLTSYNFLTSRLPRNLNLLPAGEVVRKA